jgi:hypothetical protein
MGRRGSRQPLRARRCRSKFAMVEPPLADEERGESVVWLKSQISDRAIVDCIPLLCPDESVVRSYFGAVEDDCIVARQWCGGHGLRD